MKNWSRYVNKFLLTGRMETRKLLRRRTRGVIAIAEMRQRRQETIAPASILQQPENCDYFRWELIRGGLMIAPGLFWGAEAETKILSGLFTLKIILLFTLNWSFFAECCIQIENKTLMHCFFIHFALLAQYMEGVTSDGRELLKKVCGRIPWLRFLTASLQELFSDPCPNPGPTWLIGYSLCFFFSFLDWSSDLLSYQHYFVSVKVWVQPRIRIN